MQSDDGEDDEQAEHLTRVGRAGTDGDEGTAGGRVAPAHAYPGAMRPVAVYSALRVGLFLVLLLVLRVLGVGGVLSLLVAVVLAMLLSFLVLRRQRDAVTRALMVREKERSSARATRRRSLRERLADDAQAEDEEAERAAHPRPPAGDGGAR